MIFRRKIYVYIQLPNTMETVTAASLVIDIMPDGLSIGRFTYGSRYLKRSDAVELDPLRLSLNKKIHDFTQSGGIPSALRDASPDAWGRRVIEHQLACTPFDLHEVDYLLHGPHDGAGFLSFGLNPEPPAIKRSYNRTHQLSELIIATQAIDNGLPVDDEMMQKFDPGTSMGGARPKATIEDSSCLWLGKFPAKNDRFNMQRVEFATLELARKCGLNVTESKLQPVGHDDVLMLKRFDREYTEDGYIRSGLVSGLTILDCGDSYTDRGKWSYPLLSANLRRWSFMADTDCLELFRRMVFNAAVTNNDDHPRNHAMIRVSDGWRLSPAYDLVPSPVSSIQGRDLALIIGNYGRVASIYNLISQSEKFGLSEVNARIEINNIVNCLENWEEVFRHCGVSSKDVSYISQAILPECFFFDTPSSL